MGDKITPPPPQIRVNELQHIMEINKRKSKLSWRNSFLKQRKTKVDVKIKITTLIKKVSWNQVEKWLLKLKVDLTF